MTGANGMINLIISLLCLLIVSCINDANTQEVTQMSSIRFMATQDFILPGSPGSSATVVTLPAASWDGGVFMGMEMPLTQAPVNYNPPTGCADESQVHISKYRISFLGAKDLRPANTGIIPSINSLVFSLGRFVEKGVGIGVFQLLLPFTSTEWESADMFLMVDSVTQTPYRTPKLVDSQLTIDTRNLQSVYYGSHVRVLLEIQAECILNF